ncbi:MAG: hypothetical protein IPK30_03080 [Cellvibrionales bacterium]|nr:hypothetical protein [Cellvibrionales bacterium]
MATSIARLLSAAGVKRHLFALPLPVLLENVAGVYAAVMAGVTCVTPPLAAVDLGWIKHMGCVRIFALCEMEQRAESVILLPQMLKAVLPILSAFDVSALKLVAVGGARVALGLLRAASAKSCPCTKATVCRGAVPWCALTIAARTKWEPWASLCRMLAVRLNAASELEVAGSHFFRLSRSRR